MMTSFFKKVLFFGMVMCLAVIFELKFFKSVVYGDVNISCPNNYYKIGDGDKWIQCCPNGYTADNNHKLCCQNTSTYSKPITDGMGESRLSTCVRPDIWSAKGDFTNSKGGYPGQTWCYFSKFDYPTKESCKELAASYGLTKENVDWYWDDATFVLQYRCELLCGYNEENITNGNDYPISVIKSGICYKNNINHRYKWSSYTLSDTNYELDKYSFETDCNDGKCIVGYNEKNGECYRNGIFGWLKFIIFGKYGLFVVTIILLAIILLYNIVIRNKFKLKNVNIYNKNKKRTK